MSDWTDSDYGREDGFADAHSGAEPSIDLDRPTDEYERAYAEAYIAERDREARP